MKRAAKGHDVVLCVAQIGLRAAEFYATMYALYEARGDPIIGATLTFTHNLVSTSAHTQVYLNMHVLVFLSDFNLPWSLCSAASLLWSDWHQADGVHLSQARLIHGALGHACKLMPNKEPVIQAEQVLGFMLSPDMRRM